MPVLRALEAEDVAALALDGLGLNHPHLGSVVAVWCRAPAHQTVALRDVGLGSVFQDCCTFILLTSTKLLVMRCWYLSFTLASLRRLMTVMSSTRILHWDPGHSMDWLSPSSMILVVRYSVQQVVQYWCPHSRPVIIWSMREINESSRFSIGIVPKNYGVVPRHGV